MGWMLRRFKFWLGFRMSAKRGTPTPSTDALLLESGDYLLLESGDKLLLE